MFDTSRLVHQTLGVPEMKKLEGLDTTQPASGQYPCPKNGIDPYPLRIGTSVHKPLRFLWLVIRWTPLERNNVQTGARQRCPVNWPHIQDENAFHKRRLGICAVIASCAEIAI